MSTTALETAEPILQFFAHEHLPEHLQEVSRPFGALARRIAIDLPRNPERTVALRKLLEAKDCAIRALLYKDGRRPHDASNPDSFHPPR